MNLNVGFIPYLNMNPFHQGFGPKPMSQGDLSIQFQTLSPRALGVEAEAGKIDAGAMSLVDYFRLSDRFELLGKYGIGVKRAAQSVLVFSKKPLAEFSGVCAVTDETSTSVRLLQVLLEKRFCCHVATFGRIASMHLFDGDADALLLIGDEALKAKEQGVKGFPIVTDLGEEWYVWQGTPFVFAHWAVRKNLPETIKKQLEEKLDKSLISISLDKNEYLYGFIYRLTDEHYKAMEKFRELVEAVCLNK